MSKEGGRKTWERETFDERHKKVVPPSSLGVKCHACGAGQAKSGRLKSYLALVDDGLPTIYYCWSINTCMTRLEKLDAKNIERVRKGA